MPDTCYVLADGRCVSVRACDHGPAMFEESALRRRPHLLGYDSEQKAAYVYCRECQKTYVIPVEKEQIERWLAGGFIQSVMPSLDAGTRELLVSGTCNDCFDKLFGEDEEE